MTTPRRNGFRTTFREVFALRRNGYSGPFFISVMLMSMGLWLLLPVDTFETAETYQVMDSIASEGAWGFVMIVASSVMLVSSLKRRPREVALGALGAALIWFLIFSSFTAANPYSILVPLTLILTFRCLAIFKEFGVHFDPITGEPYELLDKGEADE